MLLKPRTSMGLIFGNRCGWKFWVCWCRTNIFLLPRQVAGNGVFKIPVKKRNKNNYIFS